MLFEKGRWRLSCIRVFTSLSTLLHHRRRHLNILG
jgi:hypothetical protein